MKKLFLLALAVIFLAGCTASQSTIKVYHPDGRVEEKTEELSEAGTFHKLQEKIAEVEKYKRENPKKLVEIPQGDGKEPIVLYSAEPDVPLKAVQYEDPYIKPGADVAKTGLGLFFGDRIIDTIFDSAGDTIIKNTGGGTVTYDRSDSVNVHHAEEGSTLNQGSHNDGSDQSVTDSHDSTATPTVVTAPDPVIIPAPDPVIVRPTIVEVPATPAGE